MAIWHVFLIALYWSSQNRVETVCLPNTHLEDAILCLRECIGEDVIHKSFRYVLNYEEYIGDICKTSDVNVIEEKIKKYSRDGGQKVRECLEKKNLLDVYTKFLDYGTERLTEIEQFSDLGKYTIGLCQKDDTVNFQDLENDQEKETAFNCLKDCATRFMLRIENSLTEERDKLMNTMAKIFSIVLDEDPPKPSHEKTFFQEAIESATKPYFQNYKTEFFKSFEEQTEIDESADSLLGELGYKKRKIPDDKPSSSRTTSDIDVITTTGKPRMTRYSQVYASIDKYLRKVELPSDDEFDPALIDGLQAAFSEIEEDESLDTNLKHFFIYYTSCAKVQCYMKAPKSVPLYDFILQEASKLDSDRKEDEPEPSPERKFYVVLTGQLDDNDDLWQQ